MLGGKDKNEVLNFPSVFAVSSFGLYFQSSQRIRCPQFIILLRLLMCALYFDKVLETPVTSLMERKGAIILSAGSAQGL